MANPTIEGQIKLVWPIYADKILYELTKVTDIGIENINRFIGLEFWGQVVNGNAETVINKKYIFGLINRTTAADLPVQTSVDISNIREVKLVSAPTAAAPASVTSGKTLFVIPGVTSGSQQYCCLFEVLPAVSVEVYHA